MLEREEKVVDKNKGDALSTKDRVNVLSENTWRRREGKWEEKCLRMDISDEEKLQLEKK